MINTEYLDNRKCDKDSVGWSLKTDSTSFDIYIREKNACKIFGWQVTRYM